MKVFAKLDTTEKVIINNDHYENIEIMSILRKKFGGNWVYVDKIRENELVQIDDGTKYLGFNMETERYIKGISKLQES